MKMADFWSVTPCSLVHIDPEEKHAVSIFGAEVEKVCFSENVGIYRLVYTAPKAKRTSLTAMRAHGDA
jgi:hypothetical protein